MYRLRVDQPRMAGGLPQPEQGLENLEARPLQALALDQAETTKAVTQRLATVEDRLGIIAEQSARITKIIQQLLDYTRRRSPSREPVELGRVATTAEEVVALKVGHFFDLNRVAGEPLDLGRGVSFRSNFEGSIW